MKNIAVIPARGGSKRLPGKNLLKLGGIPLIAHSILYAKAHSDIIEAIYVSTDDAAIKECALQYGALVIDRPESLSGDNEPTATALKHVLENCSSDVHNVILMQPTNPLRPSNLLRECMNVYNGKNPDSLFTVTRHWQKLGKIVDHKFIPYNYIPGQRSQDLEPLYFENGLLYISKREVILKGKTISESALPFEVDHAFANVDIDTAEDLDYAAFLFDKFKTQH